MNRAWNIEFASWDFWMPVLILYCGRQVKIDRFGVSVK